MEILADTLASEESSRRPFRPRAQAPPPLTWVSVPWVARGGRHSQHPNHEAVARAGGGGRRCGTVLSGWVAQGPRVVEFEQGSQPRWGLAHAVATSSCTTALHLGLAVAGIGPGDEVMVPSSELHRDDQRGALRRGRPGLRRCRACDGELSAATVEPVLTERTRAIIVGAPGWDAGRRGGDQDAGRRHGILVFEDAACAVGSRSGGLPVGHESELAAWSFHPRKLLTTGEGGMITTERADWAATLRRLREHGMSVSAADRHAAGDRVVLESYLEVGFNYRMTDIQAAVGLVQLAKLPAMVDRRREIVAAYRKELGGRAGPDPGRRARGRAQQLPELLGAAGTRVADDAQRDPAVPGRSWHPGPARHHGGPSRAGVRGLLVPRPARHDGDR